MSRYFRSRLDIGRGGARFVCEDLRAGCPGLLADDGEPRDYDYLSIATRPDSAAAGAGAGVAPACAADATVRGASVRGRGRGLRFGVSGATTVEVFRHTLRARVVRQRRVARFRSRSARFTWNGRATIRGRRMRDGVHSARFTARGGAVRHVGLRRRGGRFTRSGLFRTVAGCGVIRSASLARPAFGGRGARPLDTWLRLNTPGAGHGHDPPRSPRGPAFRGAGSGGGPELPPARPGPRARALRGHHPGEAIWRGGTDRSIGHDRGLSAGRGGRRHRGEGSDSRFTTPLHDPSFHRRAAHRGRVRCGRRRRSSSLTPARREPATARRRSANVPSMPPAGGPADSSAPERERPLDASCSGGRRRCRDRSCQARVIDAVWGMTRAGIGALGSAGRFLTHGHPPPPGRHGRAGVRARGRRRGAPAPAVRARAVGDRARRGRLVPPRRPRRPPRGCARAGPCRSPSER